MTENVKGLVDIGKLILTFARVNRTTYHEDGVTPESDTDHTVMVSVCACALADKLYKNSLNIGLVAQFGVVHDLVEAYALDTDTFGISDSERKEKEIKEHQAFLQIQTEFENVYPWLSQSIEAYERLDTKEARFVKTVDKCMTMITHILNGGVYFKNRGISRDQMWEDYQSVTRSAQIKHGGEFPEVIAFIDELIEEARKETYGF